MDDRRRDPTEASTWRRAAVRPILEAYAASAAVDAVLLSESTARGDADRWSDTEVCVFWSRRPTADERAAVARAARAADLRMVATYPRGLAIAIVRRDGAVEQFWRWRMLVDRDNPLLLAREFMRIGSDLVEVHLPEVDVEHLRTRFRSNRQPLEALPTT